MRARFSVAALLIVIGLCVSIPTAAGAVGAAQAGSQVSLAADPVGLADLAGSFSGTTTTTLPPICDIDTSGPHAFDTAYPGSAAIGVINLHIQGCSSFGPMPVPPPPPYFYSGTFTITTSVGTLAGNAGGLQLTDGDFELTLVAQSGTGTFAMTTGTLIVSIQVASPTTISGSVIVPSINVVLPSNGATVSGEQVLDSIASPGTDGVAYLLTGGGLNGKVIATATSPTYYGWLAGWDTTSVPNGTYTLQSVGFFPGNVFVATSPGITITVDNPPATSVLVPSNGATLSGSTYLDASATNATSVGFVLFGGSYGYSGQLLCTATPTIYGWLCAWNTTTVPSGSYTLLSGAINSAGVAFSSGVSITVKNPPSLVDLTGSFSGTTSYTGGTGGCSFEEQVFDATYPGSSAVGSVTLHLDGCVNGTLEQQNFTYTGTFAIATSVGTLAGSAAGPIVLISTSDDFELTLRVLSGTGAFAGATGTIHVSILWPPPFGSQVTGSASVP